VFVEPAQETRPAVSAGMDVAAAAEVREMLSMMVP
jgi:hypothetical protein